VHKINQELLAGLDPHQELAALALIQTSFRQASDLLENPARAATSHWRDAAPTRRFS
jgi:hypothetical protein